MSKTTDKIEENLSQLEKKLLNLQEGLTPLFNFNDLEKQLKSLKQFTSGSIGKANDEGETCMHGNSWHNECAECNELNVVDDVLFNVFELVEEYPNDAELGAKVRELCNSYSENKDDTEE